ncbi:hypothetical protein OMP38_19455 [Cohnella ginsengisoli]|uniref:Uncharacterized protein n=1 Tax=Cohnella ginsengisoli TaxID=425004 RepID=A0A9X4KIW2_9BACL|nr:hypothetical protein [Cohnella ginsengisoli]MDG0792805.1 hypothetical protein [Cohnella ginsengisoli]
MLTLLYLASLLYKYVVYKWPSAWKETLFIVLAIACGWTTMKLGFSFSKTVMFDMRYLAVIVAPLFVRKWLSVLVIGLGIGLARLSFGVNQAALVGSFNVVAMSLLVLFILWLARSRRWPELRKMVTIVISVNVGNVAFIALFGIIPPQTLPGRYRAGHLSRQPVFMLRLHVHPAGVHDGGQALAQAENLCGAAGKAVPHLRGQGTFARAGEAGAGDDVRPGPIGLAL